MTGEPTLGNGVTNRTTTRRAGRLKWSNEMNKDLMECRKKAKQLVASNDPPRNPNGRRKGYMQLMKEFWDEAGYSELGLTSQNLRDHAEWLEKTVGNVREIIVQDVGNRDREIGRENDEMLINQLQMSSSSFATDLHNTPKMQVPEGHITSPINTSVRLLTQCAAPILASVTLAPGDFSGRCYDTRTKQKPTGADIKNVNTAVEELVKCNLVPDPSVNPFGYLWMINYILYSVVVAFYISKGWKKWGEERNRAGRSKFKLKAKEEFEAKACKVRWNISRAKAELERIKIEQENHKKRKEKSGPISKGVWDIVRSKSDIVHGKGKIQTKEIEKRL